LIPLGFGFGFELDVWFFRPKPKPKDPKKQAPNPNPNKYLGIAKKYYEKIYLLKYLNINKISLKPTNF
jgi:hypothetical protein